MIKIPTDVLCRRSSPAGSSTNQMRGISRFVGFVSSFSTLFPHPNPFLRYKPVECCDPRFHIFCLFWFCFAFSSLNLFFSGRWNEFIACANFVLRSFDRCGIKFGDVVAKSLSGLLFETSLHNQLNVLFPAGFGWRTACPMTPFIQLCAIRFAHNRRSSVKCVNFYVSPNCGSGALQRASANFRVISLGAQLNASAVLQRLFLMKMSRGSLL